MSTDILFLVKYTSMEVSRNRNPEITWWDYNVAYLWFILVYITWHIDVHYFRLSGSIQCHPDCNVDDQHRCKTFLLFFISVALLRFWRFIFCHRFYLFLNVVKTACKCINFNKKHTRKKEQQRNNNRRIFPLRVD